MKNHAFQDRDLIDFLSELIDDESEKNIFATLFSDTNEEELLEKIIRNLENVDD